MQARAVGDELVVGLVPDREILRCKGPPVQNEEERKIMVEAVKWVGEVITGENTASSLHRPDCCVQTRLEGHLLRQPKCAGCRDDSCRGVYESPVLAHHVLLSL